MRYRFLGKTGLKVSEIGFGAWAIGGSMWGPQEDEDSRMALHKALNLGCNFIDTAWAYGAGHRERLIGEVMEERGERPIVATKVPPKNWNWDNPPGTPLKDVFPSEWVETKAKESLKNLGVDCIDVLQLHTWNEEWNRQAEPLLNLVARLKRSGMIRSFGLSLKDKGPLDALELMRQDQVDCLQVFFNLLYQEPAERLFPAARQYHVGVIARVPLAFGALSGKFTPKKTFQGDDHRKNMYSGQGLKTVLAKVEKLRFLETRDRTLAEAALNWALAFPEVSVCIPGIRNVRQAESNLRALESGPLPRETVKKAARLYRNNFGLPVKKVASDKDVHAVFMSGVRITAGTRKAKAPRRAKPAGKAKRKKK